MDKITGASGRSGRRWLRGLSLLQYARISASVSWEMLSWIWPVYGAMTRDAKYCEAPDDDYDNVR